MPSTVSADRPQRICRCADPLNKREAAIPKIYSIQQRAGPSVLLRPALAFGLSRDSSIFLFRTAHHLPSVNEARPAGAQVQDGQHSLLGFRVPNST